ncbi:hypothetical protein BBJ28_00002694 [Nothophytophthora sp. Chile5]|nr:hypothetical protein BBJ28_00002694 [Nothophytophthora sp. Chile5]
MVEQSVSSGGLKMTTPTPAGAGIGAVAATTAAAPGTTGAPNKNAPHLHSVASSLRSCLDGMLPDNLRNDGAAFQQHRKLSAVTNQKSRLQAEKNSWRFGLNYLFETLKQHKDWYARNQQFVQLKKDVKRFETHVSTVRGILSESVSKLDLEAGLRGAELEGRVGAYKIMFEVTKIVSNLSRPLVKLQILKPNESSLSVYCDTFVLDIVLSGGEVTQSTVEKLIRLINRAELAVKFPSMNFEQLEQELYAKVTEACSQQVSCLKKEVSSKRAVEGVTIEFNDPLHCVPVVEPPRKRVKIDDAQSSAASSAAAGMLNVAAGGSGDPTDNEESSGATDDRDGSSKKGASSPKHLDALLPLAKGEWSGSISFIEWRGEVAFHVVGHTPLIMVGLQARKLALAAMRKQPDASEAAAATDSHEDEKLFNEFVSWTAPDGKKPILPRLHFARDHSVCSVFPPRSTLAMRQEFSLTTKEISGGLKVHSFPIPICGRSLFFHAVLLSAFCSKSNIFGQRIPADNEDAVNALIKVDVAAPERITLNTGELLGPGKPVLIEVSTKDDCLLELSVKFQATSPKANGAAAPQPQLEDAAITQKLANACHSIPLLTYYALKRTLQAETGPSAARAAAADGEDCNGIAALDGDLSASMKMEGEEMLLDEMDMF